MLDRYAHGVAYQIVFHCLAVGGRNDKISWYRCDSDGDDLR